ncbi:MAG: hypothetical protein M3O15_16205 [Acidobacteriota bacterium]|nr:hypothetical protein [Acidobacteriota bacterium]
MPLPLRRPGYHEAGELGETLAERGRLLLLEEIDARAACCRSRLRWLFSTSLAAHRDL